MIHQVLVELAQEFVGVKESGGNNRGPLIEDFQRMVDGKAQGEPWCMAFVQFCVQATARRFGIAPTLPATEHCMTAWNNARTIHKFPPSDGVVAPGFIAIWKQVGSSNGHCGIVVDASHNIMHTVEGNTSDGSGINRDGDGVYLRARNRVGMGKMVLVGFIDPFGGQ